MQRNVKWSKRAEKNYIRVIDYLIAEWNEKVIEEFERETELCIRILTQHPYIGQEAIKRKEVRKILITKHNALFYRVRRSEIFILNIFDTRQDPKKSKYQR